MSILSISVVIPNYNGRTLLEANLPSTYAALKKANIDFEIIISDDASTDDSLSFLKKNYPDIKVIEHKTNRGFSPTINAGIFAASKHLVFALNSDVKITGDYFTPQLKYFSDKDTFGVMGRIIGMDNDIIQDGGKYPAKKGTKLKSTQNFLLKNNEPEFWVPTLFLSGANALIDREKLIQLKGFDEIYAPFYAEDVDLSLRAWRLGWKCYYEDQSICRHPVSATISNFNKKGKIKTTSLRNQFILHAIHLDKKDLFLWKVQTIFTLMFAWFPLERSNFKAYKEYLKKSTEIETSKKNLELLFTKYGRRSSINEVVQEIKLQLAKSKIIKF